MQIRESELYPVHLPKKYRKLVPLKQINLNDEPLTKNIEFMRLLFRANIPEAFKRFAKITPEHLSEQTDHEMDLEKFTSSIKQPFHMILQLGAPKPEMIIFGASFNETPCLDRLAWFICPYNENNVREIRKLFKKVYKRSF